MNRGDVFPLRAARRGRGHEQQGRCYCVVVQSDRLPLSTVIVVPTSTSALDASFRPRIEVRGQDTKVLTEQIRAIDLNRLGKRIGRVTPGELASIDDALATVLSLS